MKKILMRKILVLVFILMSFGGCAESEHAVKKASPIIAQSPQTVPQASTPGSLWPGESNRNMLFMDNKGRYVNDIITIIISEASGGTNDASTNTSRASAASVNISALFGIDTSILASNPNMGAKIAAGGGSDNSLKGKGDTSRSSKLEAKISGRVIKVYDNGNMLIEGRRQLTINAEDQFIVISGIVRPQDVTAENTIQSRLISDARIVYTGMGVINDKSRPGWGIRALDWVWPF